MRKLNKNEISLLNHANRVVGNCDTHIPNNTNLFRNLIYQARYGIRELTMFSKLNIPLKGAETYTISVDTIMTNNIKSLYNHWLSVTNNTFNPRYKFAISPQYHINTIHIMIVDHFQHYQYVSIIDTKDSLDKILRQFNITDNNYTKKNFICYVM